MVGKNWGDRWPLELILGSAAVPRTQALFLSAPHSLVPLKTAGLVEADGPEVPRLRWCRGVLSLCLELGFLGIWR